MPTTSKKRYAAAITTPSSKGKGTRISAYLNLASNIKDPKLNKDFTF